MIRAGLIFLAESYGAWALRAHAKRYLKSPERSAYGLKVMCRYGHLTLVKEACEQIKEFDESIWEDIKQVIRLIIIPKGEGPHTELTSKRVLIVFEEDKSHMSTSTHFAGWLLRHYKVMQKAQQDGYWRFSRSDANDEGQALRQNFLSPRLTT